jgi:RimJ/RimL family protein N-acetyltransferase
VRKIIANEPERVGAWIQKHGGGFYREGSACIGLERDGELIAGVLYDYHNGKRGSIFMHVAANGAYWLDRNYLWACFHYPFEQLQCRTVIGLVEDTNLQARRFDEHLGFTLNAVIPEGHPEGDLLIYTMRKQDCRWLKESSRGQAQSTRAA